LGEGQALAEATVSQIVSESQVGAAPNGNDVVMVSTE
jgi:hypothetical protein